MITAEDEPTRKTIEYMGVVLHDMLPIDSS